MSTPRKGRRQLARLAGELSGRDRAILASVAHLRLMSTRHIERLHFAAEEASTLSAARRGRRTLERLVRDRLLLRLERRIGGLRAGSASFIYTIAPAGQRLIDGEGPRRRFREPSALFVEHTLAVAELFVRLHEAAGVGALRLLGLIEAEPRCWRTLTSMGGRSILKPDLFVALVVGEYEYRWFVEVDLGTEHRPALIRKCLAYEAYYRSGVEQSLQGVFPRVLWVAPDEVRAQRIAGAIEQSPQLTQALFVVTTQAEAVELLRGGRP